MHCEIYQCLSACTPTKDSTVTLNSQWDNYIFFLFLPNIFCIKTKSQELQKTRNSR